MGAFFEGEESFFFFWRTLIPVYSFFFQVMREMGFEYDPSTAGSSVRFDPPDPRDGPITFHKRG
jgi:hypothetical protein